MKLIVFLILILIFGICQAGLIEDMLSINKLHKLASEGDKADHERLFKYLSDSFTVFVQHRIWNKAEAEEIVQESLMTIAAKYREIEFTDSFSAWAYQVLENKLLGYYRTKASHNAKLKQLSDELQSAAGWSPNPVMQIKLKNCLQSVAKYSRRYARIINLIYQGFDSDAICRKLEITRNNVYNILSRARRLLRKCLEKGEI